MHRHPDGRVMTARQWAAASRLALSTLNKRLSVMSIEKAIAMGRRTHSMVVKEQKAAAKRGDFLVCNCSDCCAKRGARRPRTEAERWARMQKEITARNQAAVAAREARQ